MKIIFILSAMLLPVSASAFDFIGIWNLKDVKCSYNCYSPFIKSLRIFYKSSPETICVVYKSAERTGSLEDCYTSQNATLSFSPDKTNVTIKSNDSADSLRREKVVELKKISSDRYQYKETFLYAGRSKKYKKYWFIYDLVR